jgi:hypothetical protein
VNERNLRPASVAAAALVIGGVLLLAFPGHALGIVQLVLVTAAAATGLYALAVNVPPTGWMSPFKWMSPFVGAVRMERVTPASQELASIRAKLSGRRLRASGGPALPPETLRLLKPLIRSTLDLDPAGDVVPREAAVRLSPLTRAILACDVPTDLGWLATVRPDEHEVADAVHRVLDELDRLEPGGDRPGDLSPRQPQVR